LVEDTRCKGEAAVLYNDLAITITAWQVSGYPISAVAQGLGRVSGILPPLDAALAKLLGRVAEQNLPDGELLSKVGTDLFCWLMAEPLGTQLRRAWDRAAQMERGLRLRLSIDPPEIAALPWELLRDPERDSVFATRVATPLVRFLDQTSLFGGLAEQTAELPLNILLVLPNAAGLDLPREKEMIARAVGPLQRAVRLIVLSGPVTRTSLANALLATPYHIVHMTGHGAYVPPPAGPVRTASRDTTSPRSQSYVQLNRADGSPDWVDQQVLACLFANQPSLKLLVLNVCSSGRVDDGAAFRGLAPEMVRAGVPAVVAMQYPLSDQAAATFTAEFYQQLCAGDNTGQVDVALSHARNMLAITLPGERAFAAPVLYTHAADGVIYSLPKETAIEAVLDPKSESARLAMFMGSVESSMDFEEDWALADSASLESWRRGLREAERDYCAHLENTGTAAQQAARHGLTLVRARLAALDEALARAAD
jgi:hypothetical protein